MRPTGVRNLKSLALAVPDIFQGQSLCIGATANSKMCQGLLVVCRLGLSTTNPQTKFEISNHPLHRYKKRSKM